jgi:hypothetical protein
MSAKKKQITPDYLAKFIDCGIIDAAEVLEGQVLDNLPDRARVFSQANDSACQDTGIGHRGSAQRL